MDSYLLALAVGPVQEFIAAARRTRDLWFGSYLLSRISKAVAKSVRDGDGTLIFPAPANEVDLKPDSDLNVANVILAKLPGAAIPKAVADCAKKAAQDCWREFTTDVFKEYQGGIRRAIWDDQAQDVVEFYAA